MASVRVIAHFAVQPDRVDEFKEVALRDLVAPTRSEPGCISYDLWQENGDATRFAMVEEWESQGDLDRHLALPSLHETLGRLMPMGTGDIRTGFYHSLGDTT